MTMLDATFGPAGARLPSHPDEVVRLEGDARRAIEIGRTRLLVTGALFTVAFLVIAVRLAAVTLLQQDSAEARVAIAPPVAAPPLERADIVDRNGVVLATSLATASLYANPRQVSDPAEAAQRIVGVLPDLSEAELAAKLGSERAFVWLKRNLTPRQEYAVNRLGIPGLYFQEEDRRVYPQGSLMAHIVGFADVDNHGLAGIEQSFDDVLRGGDRSVQLSIDIRLQHVMHDELAQAMTDFNGIGAAGLILDCRTGEVLAMVSLPDFDPNAAGEAPADARFNRATLGVYEMGSTFKVFNTAMALDSGVIRIADRFDATRPIQIGRYTIHDYHAQRRWLSVPEIFMYSSNIGSARMAVEAGAAVQKSFFEKLGMFRPVSIELPEVGRPHYPAVWRTVNTMTIAFGHGMSVSPLHLASGVAAMVDGGVLRQPTLIKRAPGEVPPGQQVVSARTSQQIRELMRLVVQAGTGKMANVPGYLVGGKTGTAEKQEGHGYARSALLASFVGAFPMNDPRYVILAMVDEPKPNARSHGYATGGWVAAPAIARIVQRMAPLVGMPPLPESDAAASSQLLVDINASELAHAAE
jgi:cell division protein FtsI (penicillin-binding protein 3)